MSVAPGILLVRTKFDQNAISSETFRKWYEQVHIPDLLNTSGPDSAFRFEVAGDVPPATWPYLAIYPVRDVEWLLSEELGRVPLTSDILPGPTRHVQDVAWFDMRFYEHLAEEGNGDRETADSVTMVAFDSDQSDHTRLLHQGSISGIQPAHSSLFKLRQASCMPESAKRVGSVPQYLVLHEFNGLPDIASPETNKDLDILHFRHLASFGKKEVKW